MDYLKLCMLSETANQISWYEAFFFPVDQNCGTCWCSEGSLINRFCRLVVCWVVFQKSLVFAWLSAIFFFAVVNLCVLLLVHRPIHRLSLGGCTLLWPLSASGSGCKQFASDSDIFWCDKSVTVSATCIRLWRCHHLLQQWSATTCSGCLIWLSSASESGGICLQKSGWSTGSIPIWFLLLTVVLGRILSFSLLFIKFLVCCR